MKGILMKNRRHFLQSTAVAALPVFISGKSRAQSANGQVTLGFIGMGNHGINWNMKYFLQVPEARVLAVCDVFADRREDAKSKVNGVYRNQDCVAYADFREVLNRDDLDAVVISTPDHWHVLMSVMAARAGKDVFCEKPTLNIRQGQTLVEVMKETGVVYQGGIEDRSVDQYYRMAELVRNGVIGKLERIRITLPAGEIYEKEEEAPVPEGLDYDMWLGPAPYAPYSPSRLGQQQWRNIWDYSGGKLTDWGAHLLDTAQVAMCQEHGGPLEVNGKGVFPKDAMSTTATEYEVEYRYPNDVIVNVKSGGTGIRFEGTDGWVSCPEWRQPLEASSPEILEAVIDPKENKLWKQPASEHVDFIHAVKNRSKTTYTPEDIHCLSTAMHLGNISMRLNRPLKWDAASETIIGDDEATTYMSCAMREPWTFDI
jgi:myo-inositol 2-dehydrogenase / D-chiro-inositol 1-dehydrogenase